MERATGATRKCRAHLIYFGKYTSYEQIKEEIEIYNLENPPEDVMIQIKLLELKVTLCAQAWEEMGASEELILCRSEVEAKLCERDYGMSLEERKERFEGLNLMDFEKNLAKEVIEKTGEDVDYVKACRSKKILERLSKKMADVIKIPEEKKPVNPELKTIDEVKNFIRMRIDSFYKKEFSYPEVLEDPVETLGV